jgi:uncharacterized protein YndB with AHSA1/START domain
MSLTISQRNKSMSEQSVIHSTFVIERSYSTSPERVFAAFADPAKKRRWFAEGEHHEIEEFTMDFRVGGNERTRCILKAGPIQGQVLTGNGTYLDIVPNRRVVTASTMALGDQRISASLATFELLSTEKGTDLVFTHQGAFFEGADGPQMREGGWKKIFDRLAKEFDH